MWFNSTSNKNDVPLPAKRNILALVFLGDVLLILLFAASMYFLEKPALYVVLIGFCIVLYIHLAYQKRKINARLKRFDTLLESSLNPTHVVDGSGIIRYANPAFLRWSGMNQSSVVGQHLLDLVISPSPAENREWSSVKLVLSSGTLWTGEVELSRADQQRVTMNLILSPVFDANGKFSECFAFYNDVADRKELMRKMVETQLQYRSIVESSPDGITIVQNERLVYVNPSAVNIFGYASAEEMLSFNFSAIVAPASKPFLSLSPNGRVLGEEVLRNYELQGLTKQGKMIDLEANARVVTWNDQPAVQSSFRTITERKMLEREQTLWLWEQETLSDIDRKLVGIVDLSKIFAAILQHTLNLTRAHFSGILLFDESNTQVQWNSICGNTLQHTIEMFQPNDTLGDILKIEEPLIIQDSIDNTRYPLNQLSIIGEEKLISSAWFPLMVDGRHRGMLVVGYRQYHDFAGREKRLLTSISEKHSIAMVNAQLYADLLQRKKELEILSGARVQAQEDERRRIAREIHDGLGQMLTAIKFNLEILEDMITASKDEHERIDDMKNLLDSVMKEAREISYNLMPSVLEDFGLAPALQLLSEQFAGRTGVKVQFQAHGVTDRFDPNVEISLYRITQESLNNISKHAEATEVNLQIINHSNGIRLVIEDNGKGITNQTDLLRATGKGGMGLPGMRERASSIGGVLTIDSTPNNGTLITVEVPLKKSMNHE